MESLTEFLLPIWISLCTLIAIALAIPQELSEPSTTRDIHLTVPKNSSVNTQITSGNNTVNITDL